VERGRSRLSIGTLMASSRRDERIIETRPLRVTIKTVDWQPRSQPIAFGKQLINAQKSGRFLVAGSVALA